MCDPSSLHDFILKLLAEWRVVLGPKNKPPTTSTRLQTSPSPVASKTSFHRFFLSTRGEQDLALGVVAKAKVSEADSPFFRSPEALFLAQKNQPVSLIQ